MDCNDFAGTELEVGSKVLIVGTVTEINESESGCTVSVDIAKQREGVNLTFYSEELIKAIDGRTITGIMGGGT